MPWLALPFNDTRKASLVRLFKVLKIPKLVAIGTTGKTETTEARDLVMLHGADAYPFTEQRIKEIEEANKKIEAEYEEIAKGWSEKLKLTVHEAHELVLTSSQESENKDVDVNAVEDVKKEENSQGRVCVGDVETFASKLKSLLSGS
ncbi:hypothetical protein AgCh_019521 [Apium graveolens]